MTVYARFLDTMNFGVAWIVTMWIMVFVKEFGSAVSMEFESRPQVDLLRSLGFVNRTGVAITSGPYGSRPAVRLFGDRRDFRVPDIEASRVVNILRSSSDVTFIAQIQQEELNTGALISYSEDFDRIFELQSSGRKDELRLHYLHKGQVHVESFPYRLSDARWHRLAVTISDSEVTVFVDCQQVYKRVIRTPDRKFETSGKNMSLWLGQRGADHFMFQGSMQDVRIVGGPNGHLVQCPVADSSCPTCGQFSSLQMTVSVLESYVKELAGKLQNAEERLSQVEECECRKSCSWNNTLRTDGETWSNGCDNCICRRGEVSCKPVQCPAVSCRNPVTKPGECCPMCLKKCVSKGIWYDHGERDLEASRSCRVCECKDGSMKCSNLNPAEVCPPLSCPLAEQVSKPGECCKVCLDDDYCAKGHDCHSNATCINLRSDFMCRCDPGFVGDGKNCSDIDECLRPNEQGGSLCGNNTVCVNTAGSYSCSCLQGHARLDNFTCAEVDECATGVHDCHINAHCSNLAGNYSCDCAVGYEGNGKNCTPTCGSPCQNGGICAAPDQCSCRTGFSGPTCELDINECVLGVHKCGETSECVNKHGWYECKCRPGFRALVDHDGPSLQTTCIDIDECAEEVHTCNEEAECVNIDGGFTCKCSGPSSNCSIGCTTPSGPKTHLAVWQSPTDPCSVCACVNGVITCQPQPCSCDASVTTDSIFSLELQLVVEKFVSGWKMPKSCCKKCERREKEYCIHQEEKKRILHQGEVWIHQCQTCECLHGEIDCWALECPPVTCDNPIKAPGDCCPRCHDDPCLPSPFTNSTSDRDGEMGCHYGGVHYPNGASWPLTGDRCTSCSCKNGHACCRFSPDCPTSASGVHPVDIKFSTHNSLPKDTNRKLGRTVPTPHEYKRSTLERTSQKHIQRLLEKHLSPRQRRNAEKIKRKILRSVFREKKKMNSGKEKNY